MEIIKEKDKYLEIKDKVRPLLVDGKKFPSQVFSEEYRYFLFSEESVVTNRPFYDRLRNFLNKVGEKQFWVTVIESDPIEFYFKHYGYFATFVFDENDTTDDYLKAMEDIPKECLADSIWSSADVFAAFSASEEWIIYYDKQWEASIFAFKNDNYRQIFADICLPGLQYDPFRIPEFIIGRSKLWFLRQYG